jgi:L-amino acid N-acyltransferase YncA
VIAVREATAADWPAIWPIWRAIVATGDSYVWELDRMTEDDARAAWMLPSPWLVMVATDEDGRIVGTAKFGPNQVGRGDHVANASFMVDPSAGGRGIGMVLGQAVLDRARADGFKAMQFNAVVETNTPARALWERLGFEVVGRLPGAFRHATEGDVALLVMYRTL